MAAILSQDRATATTDYMMQSSQSEALFAQVLMSAEVKPNAPRSHHMEPLNLVSIS